MLRSQLYATNFFFVLYSPGLWYCNDVNSFMCRARLFTECPRESLDYEIIQQLLINAQSVVNKYEKYEKPVTQVQPR